MPKTIELSPSDQTFEAQDHETILDAAIRNGVSIPYGCRNGACGSCKSFLLEGEISYRRGQPDALSDEEVESATILCCMARAQTDLKIQPLDPLPSSLSNRGRFKATLVEMNRLNADVMQLMLELDDQRRLDFKAGQYINIFTASGESRAFSMANAPHLDQQLELHVRHSPGGLFTPYVFSKMQVGEVLEFEGPLGEFQFHEDSDRPLIVIAGGTGFAPIKSLIEHAMDAGIRRSIHLYWGARTQADIYLPQLPTHWTEEIAEFKYTPVLSDAKSQSNWDGATGYVHQAVLAAYSDLSQYDVYMCGPPQMVQAGLDQFPSRGLDKAHLFSDAFSYAVKKD